MQTIILAPTLRDLRPTDVAAIVALAGVLGSTESAAEWKRRLRRGSGFVAVGAEEDGRLVGYAAGAVRAMVVLAHVALSSGPFRGMARSWSEEFSPH